MIREELFEMKPLKRYVARPKEEPEVSEDYRECGLHCPPDCPILRAGNCPDSD